MRLILLRHTQTAVGSSVCYGNQDVALAVSKERDIKKVVIGLPEFSHIISSPLLRCQQLAAGAAALKGIQPSTDERLQEMNFGDWQGQSWDDVPRNELDKWAENFEEAKPHGGESIQQLRKRLQSFLADLKQNSHDNDKVLIVSHAGVIRSLLTLVENKPGTNIDERDHQVNYGEWRQIEYSKG